MGNNVYLINKGVNKSIEFKGLTAQYIWWLAACLVGLMMLFALLFVIGVNAYVCLVIILGAGAVSISKIYSMSKQYGETGMMKKLAKRSIPDVVKQRTRSLFMKRSFNNR